MRHEMAVRLRHCCCGCSLKEGTIVIGVICIILSAGALACGMCYGVKFAAHYLQTDGAWYNRPEVILPILIFEVVLCVTELVTSSLLLRGVTKYDRRLVMPWLVDNAMICGLLFLVVVGGAITCFIVTASRISGDLTTITYGFITMASGAIAVGVYVYFLLVVYSFYSLLPMLSSERVAALLDRFKNPYFHPTDQNDHTAAEGWGVNASPPFSRATERY